MKIAILVPVCSRNQKYTSINDIPFITKFYPSFLKTSENNYQYTFFIGYDDDDIFYNENYSELLKFDERIKVYKLSGCQHAPAFAWNQLAKYALDMNYDYYFQVGDDVVLINKGWTSHFINQLVTHDNYGVVGPCNKENYQLRISKGLKIVIENSFVHKTHLQIFGFYFHPNIKNWYCDNWITDIYEDIFSEIQLNFICLNSIVDNRYNIIIPDHYNQYVLDGKTKIQNFTQI